ncbi:MAG: alkaline phosphatase D family protein [Phycisphaerales bacterium]|nr:MAG: alkaline phosphatase D family protein [Phycisphaerales bacterium]
MMKKLPSKGAKRSLLWMLLTMVCLPAFSKEELRGIGVEIGSKSSGMEILNMWGKQPAEIQELYRIISNVLSERADASFADVSENDAFQKLCEETGIRHLGGPMLGCVEEDSVKVWLRTCRPAKVKIRLVVDGKIKTYGPVRSNPESDLTAVVHVTGLKPETRYPYEVLVDGEAIAIPDHAAITTAPDGSKVRIAFGTCLHRWGIGNQRQADLITSREPTAMLLYGDIAVQDKRNHLGKHRADYQVRDFFPAWRSLSATIPVYATWDDHDYFANDKSGIPKGYTDADRAGVRQVFIQCWNNPSYGFNDRRGGIFLRTRMGPCDILMLDNRYFRTGEERGFLGNEQTAWLKKQLLDCEGPFIILSCGTMWSDYVSGGKDSWGKYDPAGREEIFTLIEENRIPGVLLISGDRHGACGFRIPRPSGYQFYEFEAASLGGRKGPASKAASFATCLYSLSDKYAFGEFTFDATKGDPEVSFKLMGADGAVLYALDLKRSQLTPP